MIGIDDVPAATIVDPPLTTIAIPLHQLGAIGMESLLRLRAGELSLDDEVTLAHSVVVRGSVANVRGGRRGQEREPRHAVSSAPVPSGHMP